MKLPLIIESWKKGSWYVARAPELDFISQGRTPEGARKNLLEVISIQFEEKGFSPYLELSWGKTSSGYSRVRRSGRRNNQKQHANRWYDEGSIF